MEDAAPPLTREALFERAWSEPMQSLATRYGLSGRGLAKLCEKLRIPVPGRGYWAKRRAGHRVSRPRLPALDDLSIRADAIVLTKREADPRAEDRRAAPAVAAQQANEAEPAHQITVAPSLEAARPWHPLVASVASPRRAQANARRQAMAHSDVLSPEIRVSDAVRERALCILDALAKALEERGCAVECRMPRPHMSSRGSLEPVTSWPSRVYSKATCIGVGDQDVLLTLRELDKQIKPRPRNRRHRGAVLRVATSPPCRPLPASWTTRDSDSCPPGASRSSSRTTSAGGAPFAPGPIPARADEGRGWRSSSTA